jgi:long-chain fatty acid transport protein
MFLSFSVVASACSVAQAGGFALREQSAAGQGASFAGAAAGGAGLGSMFWNPATMTQYSGLQSYFTITGIAPQSGISAKATSPTYAYGAESGDIGRSAVVPASSASYQLNDRIWLGLAVNAPHGLTTKSPLNWSGQVYARTSKIFSSNVNPNVAFKVNDWLSIAAGVQVEYFKTSLKSALAATPNATGLALEGDGMGYGFTTGVLLTPFAGLDLGVGYRSRMTVGLSGDDGRGEPVPLDALGDSLDGVDIVARVARPLHQRVRLDHDRRDGRGLAHALVSSHQSAQQFGVS